MSKVSTLLTKCMMSLIFPFWYFHNILFIFQAMYYPCPCRLIELFFELVFWCHYKVLACFSVFIYWATTSKSCDFVKVYFKFRLYLEMDIFLQGFYNRFVWPFYSCNDPTSNIAKLCNLSLQILSFLPSLQHVCEFWKKLIFGVNIWNGYEANLSGSDANHVTRKWDMWWHTQ